MAMQLGAPTPLQPEVKVPPVVPLAEADATRQALYGPLVRAATGEEAPPVTVHIPDEDKKAFTQAILGGVPYEKRYDLFGNTVKVLMMDRTTAGMDQLYFWTAELLKLKQIDDNVDLWLERFRLTLTLKTLELGGRPIPLSKPKSETELLTLAQSLMQLSKPLYTALIETSRHFEAHVETMTVEARNPPFWKIGGSGSH